MIRNLLLAAALGAGLVAANGAAAQKLEYDCDTGADHFSQLKLAGDATSHGIAGKITARQFYKSGKYIPVANVRLEGPDGWGVQIRLSGTVKTGPTLMLGSLLTLHNGSIAGKTPFEGIFDATSPLEFALTIAPDGAGTAALGGQTLHFTARTDKLAPEVGCSTGEFLFNALDLER
jgi:hypothetical protein